MRSVIALEGDMTGGNVEVNVVGPARRTTEAARVSRVSEVRGWSRAVLETPEQEERSHQG